MVNNSPMKLWKGVEPPILIHFNGEKPRQSTSPITHRNLKSIHIWRTFASFVLQKKGNSKKNTLVYRIPNAKIKMAAAAPNSKMDRGRCESKERPFRFIRPFFLYLTSSSTGRLEAHAGSEGICVSWPYRLLHVNTPGPSCWVLGSRTRLGTPLFEADFLDM